MSNTIAHLAVAWEILKRNNFIKNQKAYYLGVVAPDTIGSKENALREDKKRVHLRSDISDLDWLSPEYMNIFDDRVKEFAEEHILKEKDEAQKEFNIGFLVHLLTDKWNHKTIRQKMLKEACRETIKESDKAFFYMMLNDLGALDKYILDRNKEIEQLFEGICATPVRYSLSGFIEKEYIEKSILWWKEEYIPQISELELKYLSEKDIEEFISVSSEEVLEELEIRKILHK